jgi:hypothetical protein
VTDTLRPATTTVALRGSPVFAAIVNDAVPDPVRVPEGIVIHAGVPVTVQVQPEPVVTESVPESPVAAADTVVGVTVKEHELPACSMKNVRPAIVTVPFRTVAAVFGATATVTVPDPVPLAPFWTVSHAAFAVALQVHDAVVVTPTVVVPPAATDVYVPGEML